jgi:hypothetical protein
MDDNTKAKLGKLEFMLGECACGLDDTHLNVPAEGDEGYDPELDSALAEAYENVLGAEVILANLRITHEAQARMLPKANVSCDEHGDKLTSSVCSMLTGQFKVHSLHFTCRPH